MKRVTLTAFMVCAAWLSFGQTARFGDLNRNSVVVTSAPPQSVVSVNGQTGAVVVTAAGLGAATTQQVAEAVSGAITNEQDLAALRTYHYGSPDIVESPAEWFVFDGAGTITAFNWAAGRTNVVIPWAIGGVPVTAIGDSVFQLSDIVSVIAPQTVTVIEAYAFAACTSLASVLLPQATAIEDYAFTGCLSLASVSLPQATSIGTYAFVACISLTSVHMGRNAPAEATGVFSNITPPPTVYVTDPHATGWGDTWNGAPVVRPNLYADAVYQAGELVATTGHVAQVIASQLPGIVYSNSVSALTIYTNASGAATSWWQVASGVTNSGTFTSGATNITDGVTSGTYSEVTRTLDISNLLAGVSMELPDGIVTNGMGGLLLATNATGAGFVKISGSGGGWGSAIEVTGNIYLSNWGSPYIRFPAGEYVAGGVFYGGSSEMGFKAWMGAEKWVIRSLNGNAYIDNGSLTVAGTNTAAVVRSTGGYIIGPTISGKQAHIFTDGTNCFFVNVNSVTNALTTN